MTRKTRSDARYVLRVALVAGLTLVSALQAQAQANDQILQLFPSGGQGCSDTVKLNLTNAIRSGIEAEVLRGEEALKKPCLLYTSDAADE